jgi:hypothetical protein
LFPHPAILLYYTVCVLAIDKEPVHLQYSRL